MKRSPWFQASTSASPVTRRVHRRVLRVLGVLALACVLVTPAAYARTAPVERDVFTVYMAPPGKGGSDQNSGRSPQSAVASLARVQQVLKASHPGTDVEVRIEQGVYEAPPLGSWTFYVPGHTVSFLPIDYSYGEGMGGIEGRPVFRNEQGAAGNSPNGAWMTMRLGGALPDGGKSRLRFYYLRVEGYSDGLSVMGLEYGEDTDGGNPPYFKKTSAGLNRNVLAGMVFYKIGTRWTGDNTSHGYGGVVLTNSSHNTITNSHFTNIENTGDRAGMIHAVYVTHFSSQNTVSKSRFKYVSGAPIKVRDRSNLNSFEHSTFVRTGTSEYYRDDVCDKQCYIRYDARALECAGYHNRFIHNRLVSGYHGGQPERVWRMFPWKPTNAESLRYAGEPGRCSLPEGETRLRTWGNTRS